MSIHFDVANPVCQDTQGGRQRQPLRRQEIGVKFVIIIAVLLINSNLSVSLVLQI